MKIDRPYVFRSTESQLDELRPDVQCSQIEP